MPDPFDHIISTRIIKDGAFGKDPGPVNFLRVPTSAKAYVPDHIIDREEWATEVQGLADGDNNPLSVSPTGDVLVFVHGYNNAPDVILTRLRALRANLRAEGWRGHVIAFDWPSDNNTLNYFEDRTDAAAVAHELVENCLRMLVRRQARRCETNVHLLGHSTGAYVIMEAFAQTPIKGDLFQGAWRLGQVAFIAGDVSRDSLGADSEWAKPMFNRIMRLTNYANGHDPVLAVSNAKRLGVAPRAGRVGVPANAHPKVVNVDCTTFFANLDPKTQPKDPGVWAHSWHINNRVFVRDLAMTLEGASDRNAISTREQGAASLELKNAPRPKFQKRWGIDDAAPPGRVRPLDAAQ